MTKIDLSTAALPTAAFLAIQGVGKVQVTLTGRSRRSLTEFINFTSETLGDHFIFSTQGGWGYSDEALPVTAYAA